MDYVIVDTSPMALVSDAEELAQIADASIEIEKKIKELSEKELQNEKVIIDILSKCFKDKEDIASMVEGDNLELLVEKVMELVRNLYL